MTPTIRKMDLKQEMDLWIREINPKIGDIEKIKNAVVDNVENIDHNYELINELVSQVRVLKEEVATLRLVNLLQLKSAVAKA